MMYKFVDHTLPAVVPSSDVTDSRLVVSLEAGFRLLRESRQVDGWQDRAASWDFDVLDVLLASVLPVNGVMICDIRLTVERLAVLGNTVELAERYSGRIKEIVLHGHFVFEKIIPISPEGAVIHIITDDHFKSFPGDYLRDAWSVMLKSIGGLSIEGADRLSVPSALEVGRRSHFDEVVLVDFPVQGSVLPVLTGYRSDK